MPRLSLCVALMPFLLLLLGYFLGFSIGTRTGYLEARAVYL